MGGSLYQFCSVFFSLTTTSQLPCKQDSLGNTHKQHTHNTHNTHNTHTHTQQHTHKQLVKELYRFRHIALRRLVPVVYIRC
jgi:hypothetical protein